MRQAVLIVNPFASSVSERNLAAVGTALAPFVELHVVQTQAPGHATELAREACDDGCDALFVFSGDGGFNEALNGVEKDIPLGFIPGGGTSVFPRALGLPRNPIAAAAQIGEALEAGRTRRISLGRANGRRFCFSAGIGFDAETVRRFDRLGRREDGHRPGDVRFGLTLAGVLWERRGRWAPSLEIAGVGRAAFALVANCDPYTYAGSVPLHVAPHARFELGLDLVAPRALTPGHIPRFLGHVALGRGHDEDDALFHRHDLDRIEIECDEPMPLQVDGEDLGDVDRVEIVAEREVVSVLV